MLGSRIEELLASEMEANGGFAVITDEAKQRQLLLDDEEEDFMDEGIENNWASSILVWECWGPLNFGISTNKLGDTKVSTAEVGVMSNIFIST